MPHYFFDLSNSERETDETGIELPDDNAAQCEAIRFAGEILRHQPGRLEQGSMKVDVSDRAQRVLFSVDVKLVHDGWPRHGEPSS